MCDRSHPLTTTVCTHRTPLLCRYLQKQTKDGKWQKRYFETNGNFLTYYKSKKMTKLLAAVNLPQVGEIKVIDPDPENDDTRDGGLFTIQLNSRDYTLKAADHQEALEWVDVLKKLKRSSSEQGEGGSDTYEKSTSGPPTAEVEKKKRGGFCKMCQGA